MPNSVPIAAPNLNNFQTCVRPNEDFAKKVKKMRMLNGVALLTAVIASFRSMSIFIVALSCFPEIAVMYPTTTTAVALGFYDIANRRTLIVP